MRVLKRSIACLLVAAVLPLSACQTSAPPSIKQTPPLVSNCLVAPARQVTAPPAPPAQLTADWAKRIWRWASDTLGLVAADREEWAGERVCIRGKVETGAIR